MNRDDIIRMAREAFHDHDKVDAWQNGFWVITQEELERFAKLAASAEREECAQLAEAHAYMSDNFNALAEEIRARGKK